MKQWSCPNCKIPRESEEEHLIKICLRCGKRMVVKDEIST